MSEQPLRRGTRKEVTGTTAKVRARKEVSYSQNEWRRWAELLVQYRRGPAYNQSTIRAQSELSQSYSQSSVRAGFFPRKFVFYRNHYFLYY